MGAPLFSFRVNQLPVISALTNDAFPLKEILKFSGLQNAFEL